jgi:hypothetical protein
MESAITEDPIGSTTCPKCQGLKSSGEFGCLPCQRVWAAETVLSLITPTMSVEDAFVLVERLKADRDSVMEAGVTLNFAQLTLLEFKVSLAIALMVTKVYGHTTPIGRLDATTPAQIHIEGIVAGASLRCSRCMVQGSVKFAYDGKVALLKGYLFTDVCASRTSEVFGSLTDAIEATQNFRYTEGGSSYHDFHTIRQTVRVLPGRVIRLITLHRCEGCPAYFEFTYELEWSENPADLHWTWDLTDSEVLDHYPEPEPEPDYDSYEPDEDSSDDDDSSEPEPEIKLPQIPESAKLTGARFHELLVRMESVGHPEPQSCPASCGHCADCNTVHHASECPNG